MNYNLGLYAQDQWTINRLTLNLGVRADFLNAQVDAAEPARGSADSGPRVRRDQERAELAGRVPAIWASPTISSATARRRSRRHWAATSLASRTRIARAVNPLQSTVSNASRTWNDSVYPVGDPRRGNFAPDCDLKNVAANGECGPANFTTFGQIIVTHEIRRGSRPRLRRATVQLGGESQRPARASSPASPSLAATSAGGTATSPSSRGTPRSRRTSR